MAYYANSEFKGLFMPTRNVVITERHAKLIDRLVAEGRFQNGSEVLREGLRLVEARQAGEEAKLKALREAVQVGIDDIEAGRFYDFKSWDEFNNALDEWTEEALNEPALKPAAE
jgi:antitoxin ParD1/3/4